MAAVQFPYFKTHTLIVDRAKKKAKTLLLSVFILTTLTRQSAASGELERTFT